MVIQFGTSGWQTQDAQDSSVARTCFESADGVAARLGLISAQGSPTSPHQSTVLFFEYLVESRKWTGGAARSVATSHLVNRVAEARILPVYETTVGFKSIGESINEVKTVIAGKNSAGFSNKGHDPQKDGILAGLLATKAVASCGSRLADQ